MLDYPEPTLYATPLRMLAASLACALLAACGSDHEPPPGAAPLTTPGERAVNEVVDPITTVSREDWGAPLGAPERDWTWVDFPEARCMNGTPTGIGLNLVPGAKRLVIYLEGGGACFDATSCLVGTLHQGGFGAVTFAVEMALTGAIGIFDRRNDDNPFKDDSWVFVPYCSGDVHAGASLDGTFGRKHLGYVNIGHYLRRIVPTFVDISSVVLAGSSAGGFGATFNYDRVQRAFGTIPVHLLDDAGPVMTDDYLKPCLQQRLRRSWNLTQTLPVDCAACGQSLGALHPFLAAKYPERRFGLVSGTWDDVIRTFMGPGYASCFGPGLMLPTEFASGLGAIEQTLAPFPNAHVFYIRSNKHTWLLDAPLGFAAFGTSLPLTTWLRGFADGTADFRNVVP